MGCLEKCGSSVVRSSSFGRKRVAADMEFESAAAAGKRFAGQSPLESLPQELLIRIVCGVEHDDLQSLLSVSKALREAALVAKHAHFAYRTPRKKSLGWRNTGVLGDWEDVEAPNAPKQTRVSASRLGSGKKLADISVALFKDLVLELEN
ncbi:F-box protein At1g61340-like [Andrographis paniculata]|uniref:F-box protein At1g61340-like n=1 Tax=Andrographis paniculata TaxID=175694 RepID=UPI0021E7D495|nr:F-box protein At1g61340-like [Andrographis paniculata]